MIILNISTKSSQPIIFTDYSTLSGERLVISGNNQT